MDLPLPKKMLKVNTLIDQLQPLFSRFESKQAILPTLSKLVYQPLPPFTSIIKVPSSQLQALHHSNQTKQSQIISLKQQINNYQMTLEVTTLSMDQYKSRCKELMGTCEELYKISQRQADQYKVLEEKHLQLSQQQQEQFLNTKPNYKLNFLGETKFQAGNKEYSTQTDYWIPILEVKRVEVSEPSSTSKSEVEKRVELVTSRLQSYLETVSGQVGSSLENIQNQEITLRELIEKNEELSKENGKLREQAQEFSLDKEKFRTWREQVDHRMTELMKLADSSCGVSINLTDNIIEEYEPKSKIQVKEENIYMRNQIKKLRDTIIRLELELKAEKLRARIASSQPQPHPPKQAPATEPVDEDSLNLEKTMKTLSQLSSKLKVVSHYLLSQTR